MTKQTFIYDALYLSPHLDDAVLSCGGQIIQRVGRGERVLIVTFMAGDPPADRLSELTSHLHERWGVNLENVMAVRRLEDEQSCHILGSEWEHRSWLDCIYRVSPQTGQTMYHSIAEIFGEIDPDEQEMMVTTLMADMAQLPIARQIFAPLTIGNHVDHQLIRLAAERHFGHKGLFYYEDYPYARNGEKRAAVLGEHHQLVATIPLSNADLVQKCQAIAAHRSQISSLFADVEDMKAQVAAYHEALGGESIWRVGR